MSWDENYDPSYYPPPPPDPEEINHPNEQKFYIGNWIQHKEKPELVALIHSVFDNDFGDLFYDIAFIGPSEHIQGFCGQEDLEKNYKLISLPWQLFFKVGDKVKIVGVPNSGIITKISTFAESPKPLYVRTESAGGKEYIDVYAPHELVKIGER